MQKLTLFLSAAEASSDQHAAKLCGSLQELAKKQNFEIDIVGIGGSALEKTGMKILVPAREIQSMGFFEVFFRLPKIFNALRKIKKWIQEKKPNAILLLDFPGFHFKLARQIQNLRIPMMYYIPPKVWVWKKHRIHFLKKAFVKVFGIFPFEEEIFKKEDVPFQYVGNPLVEERDFFLSKEEARNRLGISEKSFVLAVMPGSRGAELRRHTPLLLDTSLEFLAYTRKSGLIAMNEKLVLLLPLNSTTKDVAIHQKKIEKTFSRYSSQIDFRMVLDQTFCVLKSANVGLIKSGTSTLEAALAGLPHLIFYKTSLITEWLFKLLVRYQGSVGLSNIVWQNLNHGVPAFQEILGTKVSSHRLAKELFELCTHSEKWKLQEVALQKIYDQFTKGHELSSSEKVAQEVLEIIRTQTGKREE